MCSSLLDLYMARYAKGGRGELDPATGVPLYDCWGLAMAAHAFFGVQLPDFRHDPAQLRTVAREFAAQEQSGRWERLAEPVAPCIVAMRYDDHAVRCVNHFGTYIGGGNMLHILNEAEVHVAALTDAPYPSRIAGFWRYNAS